MISIRNANLADAEKLLAIYAPYVENTAISFEYDVPTLEDFRSRIENTLKKYPYLVAEENGEIVGYCYAGQFHTRRAYRISAELSIYIEQSHRKQGIGRALYDEMESRLKEMGVRNLYAGTAYIDTEDEHLTHDSLHFHEKMGFTECAHHNRCGEKFGTLYDLVYMEKII